MAKLRFCEVCKQLIEEERAVNDCETRLCIVHGEAIQKFGGEFKTIATQERTSKEGSLKINYGETRTTKIRNQDGVNQLREEFLDAN